MCPGVVTAFPAAPPGLAWRTPAELADGPHALLAACAFAACASLSAPPLAPDPSPRPPAAPPASAEYWAGAVDGMADSSSALQAVLVAGSPYLQSWAPLVGRAHDRVLDATADRLRRPCPALDDPRLALLPFTPRHCPPTTPPITYATNGSPPAGFAPTCEADLLEPAALAQYEAWVERNMVYVMDCRTRGVAAQRGRVDTLVITQEHFKPAARGVVWEYCPASGRYVPADFGAPPPATRSGTWPSWLRRWPTTRTSSSCRAWSTAPPRAATLPA